MVSYTIQRFAGSIVCHTDVLHCKQIWHNEEYRLFRIGIHGGREEASFAHGLEMDNEPENRYSLQPNLCAKPDGLLRT